MAAPNLIPLSQAQDINEVGGKAINLAKLMQAKLPVPDGFVVTTTAFKNSPDGRVSEALADEITEAYEAMDVNLVVARSSATAEDMAGASMAGQYETYLNLMSAKDLIDGVERCWRSLYSDRIKAYLNEKGIAPESVAMAVVVQQLVAADVAGVLFTADPKTGATDKMVIEAAWGLGDPVVSGEVQPDVIEISQSEPRINRYDVATKKLILHPGSKELFPVKAEKQNKACLKYEQIMRLQELGNFAVDYFGGPQDIEWAVEAGEVYVLQSRPITTLNETRAQNEILEDAKFELQALSAAGYGPWVRHNLGETLPRPTPFTWSLLSEFMSGDGGFGRMHEQVGFKPGPKVRGGQSSLKKIGSEIYMDCSLMTEMFAENYPYQYDANVLREDPDAAQKPPTIASGTLSELGEAGKMATEVMANIKAMSADLDKRFDGEFIREVDQWCKAQATYEQGEITHFSDNDLIEHWELQVDKVLGEFGQMAFLPSMVESLAVDDLLQFLEEHAWEEEPHELLTLFSVGTQNDATLLGNIELAKVARGELTLESWLARFGHRAPSEFELATPRWTERPDDVKHMAELMAKDTDIDGIHYQRLQAAEAGLERFAKILAPDHLDELKRRVDLVQRYCRFREDGKFQLMRAYAMLRITALEFGRRLEIGEDVFFLEPAEVLQALRSGFVPIDLIERRKFTYKIEHRLKLPHVIDSEDISKLGTPTVMSDGPAMSAYSVSNGVASGEVKIVFSPEAVSSLPAGSILVCPSTDPSWTPLFANAAGVVLERGGSLSHGAVVAREMGLPAVVLDDATSSFKEGETITVDADSGWIYRDGADVTEDGKEEATAQDFHIPWRMMPPAPGKKEQHINQLGLIFALGWGVILAAIFLLPPHILNDPIMKLLDQSIWPLINGFGMAGAVAIIAFIFGLVPIMMQRYLTDNARLVEAKRRSGILRKEAAKLPKGSPRQKKMEQLAGPITTRMLKAAMVPLAFILGPMIMVFMWFPARVDPASWAVDPGRMVSVVAEINGECRENITLAVPDPLSMEGELASSKSLPPIRQELESLRREWRQASPMTDLPWEVRSAGDHARKTMLTSLNTYLSQGVPPQKLSWLIDVPEDAHGAHPVKIVIGDTGEDSPKVAAAFDIVFGQSAPPADPIITSRNPDLISVTVNYPRALQKPVFWAPMAPIGFNYDFGWLGVYLLAYLPIMFLAKAVLKVP